MIRLFRVGQIGKTVETGQMERGIRPRRWVEMGTVSTTKSSRTGQPDIDHWLKSPPPRIREQMPLKRTLAVSFLHHWVQAGAVSHSKLIQSTECVL